MLQFFRRIINSRVGIVVTFALLILIAILFGLGDVTGLRGRGGSVAQDSVASVGGESITVNDLRQRIQNEFQAAQAQNPSLTIAQFVDAGGVEAVLERTINGIALQQFGQSEKMFVSKRMVDGQIASIPSLQNASGQFDPKLYEALLQQRRMTDAQVRGDIARDVAAQQLIAPTIGASLVPDSFVAPYASLLLEKREGSIGFIPAKAVAGGPAPTDAELQSFYAANKSRYIVPERRVIRYALVTPETVKAQATPTDVEVAQAYQARAADFQPTEKRTIDQATIADRAAADALAAKVKAGGSIADAARAAGLEPRTLTGTTKAAYAGQTSAAVADAAFGAGQGALIGPVKGAIGYVVARVTRIEHVAGKSLEQAKPELAKTLTATKTAAALAKIRDALDEAQGNGANFSELVSGQKLTAETSAPLTAAGANPDDPVIKAALAARATNPTAPAPPPPDPKLAAIAQAGFQAEVGDKPAVAPIAQDGSFALVSLDKVVPAAPRPLAEVRKAAVVDFAADRAQRAARTIAGEALAKANGGASLSQALAAIKLTLPPVKPISAIRAQLAAQRGAAAAPLVLLFSMQPHTAKVLEAPNHSGWLLIQLDTITPGEARGTQAALDQTRAGFARVIGREYAEQFTRAVQAQIGVDRSASAIAKLKAELSGRAEPGQ